MSNDGIAPAPTQHFDNKFKPKPNIHDTTTRLASKDAALNRLGKKAKVAGA